MEITAQVDESVKKLFVFDEVYPARAAQEQAERKKLDAFSTLDRLNPLNRPKTETVTLAHWELRYDPFWLISAYREVDYVHEAVYPVRVPNADTTEVTIGDHHYPVAPSGGKGQVEIPVKEHCHRRIDVSLCQDGLNRRTFSSAALQSYIDRYKASEVIELDRTDAVVNKVPLTSIIQIVTSQLTQPVFDAHHIESDSIVIEKAYLYYRPVFAFEFAWGAKDKTGVLEIDGLTGAIIENGTWLREKIGHMASRETLFDIGAEVANIALPGGGIIVKVIGMIARPSQPEK